MCFILVGCFNTTSGPPGTHLFHKQKSIPTVNIFYAELLKLKNEKKILNEQKVGMLLQKKSIYKRSRDR